MTAGVVQVAPDSTGKKIDNSELTVGANTVERQRIVLADDATAAALAAVLAADPTGANYGLVVRGMNQGNVAHAAADAGFPLKIGGKATLNTAAYPTAVTGAQRADVMVDEFGRLRVVVNRARVLTGYKFESGILSVNAAADASTGGHLWIVNPVGSTVVARIKKLICTVWPTAATAFVSAPRLTIERFTFTGTASGAAVTLAKTDSNLAAATSSVRTASTGLTITAGAVCGDFSVPAVLTAVGIHFPYDQWLYDSTDDDDYIVLRAGEGMVIRQADAGSTSDTRKFSLFGAVEES